MTDRGLSLCEAIRGEHHPETATWLNNTGELLLLQRRYQESCHFFAKAHNILAELKGESDHEALVALENAAIAHHAAGDSATTILYVQQLLVLLHKRYQGGYNEKVLEPSLVLAFALLAQVRASTHAFLDMFASSLFLHTPLHFESQKRAIEAKAIYVDCLAHVESLALLTHPDEHHAHLVRCIEGAGKCWFLLGDFQVLNQSPELPSTPAYVQFDSLSGTAALALVLVLHRCGASLESRGALQSLSAHGGRTAAFAANTSSAGQSASRGGAAARASERRHGRHRQEVCASCATETSTLAKELEASVFLGDLNDYIQPSQACINPLFTPNAPAEDGAARPLGVAKISLETELSADDWGMQEPTVKPNIIRTTEKEKATISLDDCLACSGCVTSAETVLISQQSVQELLDVLSAKQHRHFVVTLSPQSRASLAAHFDLPVIAVHRKLVTMFRTLGVNMVIDSTCSGDFALLESRAEFIHRYKNQQKTVWTRPPSSVAVSSSKTEFVEPITSANPLQDPLKAMPMLASSCPGWICYAEKTQPNAIPFIDTTKSPQQIAGSLIKHMVSREQNIAPNEVYHVAVMPCFDKKLEASRKDFLDEEAQVKDVDCVLATTEIIELITTLNVDFVNLELAQLSQQEIMLSGISEDGSAVLGSNVNASSGGPLEHIFRYAAKELFNVDVDGPLEYVVGRNPDFREVTLVVEGKEVLKFAIAYGFRNIQSIMTKIRRNKCPYHYVEIMACPSGCLNGGGQIKPKSTLLASELLGNVTSRFQELQVRAPTDNPACKYVYEKYFGGQPFSEGAQKAFHTTYHAVPKLELSNPLGIKW